MKSGKFTGNILHFHGQSAYDKDVICQVPMCGCYQAMNAELALEASEYLLAEEEIHMECGTGTCTASLGRTYGTDRSTYHGRRCA